MHEHSDTPSSPDSTRVDVPPLSELIPLADLPSRIPEGHAGRRIHSHVPYRWAAKGLAGVVLQTITLPGTGKATTVEWYRRFVVEVAAARDELQPKPSHSRRSARVSGDRSERTQRVLERHQLRTESPEA
jgi:hypothetical protein